MEDANGAWRSFARGGADAAAAARTRGWTCARCVEAIAIANATTARRRVIRTREPVEANTRTSAADRKEFIKISQAIAMGFVAMGTVGYLVKLSTSTLPPRHSLVATGS